MFVLENEAIEFIRDTYLAYAKANKTYDKAEANKLDFEAMAERVEKKSKQRMAVVKQDCDSFDIMPLATAEKEGKRVLLSTKIDRFIASFSGGKDSQVVLDLCTRAIPPTDFEVIYSDTGYELPPSHTLYKDVEAYYKQKFPSLRFLTARNHESVLNYWDKIGTPSDNHRWCCSVMKTAPLYRTLMAGTDKKQKFLAFEGVRAEESVSRSDYNRIVILLTKLRNPLNTLEIIYLVITGEVISAKHSGRVCWVRMPHWDIYYTIIIQEKNVHVISQPSK